MPAKLLYIVTSAVSADVLLRGHLRAVAAAGFDVTVITSPDLDLDAIAEREGVRLIPVRMEREMSPVQDLRSLLSLYLTLREIQPDIVNASTPKAGLLGMMAAWIAGVPVRVYQLRGLRLETVDGWRRRVLLATEWLASRAATIVVCNSPSLRAAFLALRLVSPAKVTVLGGGSGNGVDTGRFHPPVRGDAGIVRLGSSLGLNGDDTVIGFVGRLTRDKGVCDLVAAYDEVRKTFDRVRLLLVGDWEEGDRLPDEVRQRIVHDERIIVTGFVDDTSLYYGVMDLLAFPSYREGFPNVPLEAGASGVPVVGYRATGTVDAVVDGETGILAPVADSEALTRGICTLLGDPLLRERMGTAACDRAVRMYDSRKVWRKWIAFYQGQLAERVSPAP